jgi:hypothetical protein
VKHDVHLKPMGSGLALMTVIHDLCVCTCVVTTQHSPQWMDAHRPRASQEQCREAV